MKEETAKLIAAVTEYLRQAVELGKEQVPLLVQEYLRWAFVTSVVYSVLGFVMVVGALGALRWSYTRPRKTGHYSYSNLAASSIVANVCAAIGGGVGMLLLIINTYKLMYVWLAPRAYMLGVLKGLVL